MFTAWTVKLRAIDSETIDTALFKKGSAVR